MENKKKLTGQIIFLVLIFSGTVYAVFHGENLSQTAEIIKNIKKIYLIPAVLCVCFFIWGESIIIYYMMGTLHIKLKKWTCFLFSSVGFFFSCITPSASGGQPAQIYYMKKQGIPIPIATLILMIVTITYKAVLVLIGFGILLVGRGFIYIYLTDILPVFYLGIVLNVFCVGFMMLLVFHTTLTATILTKILMMLESLHVLHYKKSRHEKLDLGIQKYQKTAMYFSTHRVVVVYVLMITFAQRIALFLSTYFVYRAFGLTHVSIATIILLQAVISISVDMLPLPGGMGISEKLFLTIFLPVFGKNLLLAGMILSRGLSYYTELLLSAGFTILAHFTIKGDDTNGV